MSEEESQQLEQPAEGQEESSRLTSRGRSLKRAPSETLSKLANKIARLHVQTAASNQQATERLIDTKLQGITSAYALLQQQFNTLAAAAKKTPSKPAKQTEAPAEETKQVGEADTSIDTSADYPSDIH
jgi:hypothetical protein